MIRKLYVVQLRTDQKGSKIIFQFRGDDGVVKTASTFFNLDDSPFRVSQSVLRLHGRLARLAHEPFDPPRDRPSGRDPRDHVEL